MYLDAKILKINDNGTVLVKANCDKECQVCKGSMFCKQKDTTFFAKTDNQQISIGANVRVYLPPKQTIFSTFVLFCFPILIMGIFLLLGQLNVIGTLTSAILSVLGLLASYVILFFINKSTRMRTLPVITEVYGS